MQTPPSVKSEDKVLAALAHGSALLPMWGTIAAAMIWVTQRQRSTFVRFHALQALSYQVLSFWVFTWLWPILLIGLLVLMFALIAVRGPDAVDDETAGAVFAIGFQFVLWGLILGGFGLYVLIGLIGAGFSLAGREFRYPLIGKALARKLGYSANEQGLLDEQEKRVAGALGHGAAILLVFGAILPLAIWITQKDRSRFLAFQGLQAALYQGLAALGYFLGMGLYLLSYVGLLGFGLAGALEHGSEPNAAAMLLILFPMLCFGLVVAIGGPLFHLFAVIAGLRVLRGHDYHYPLLGKFLRKRMEAAAPTPSKSS